MVRKNFITSGEMEEITEQILSEYGFPLTWEGKPAVVPIDEIIEFHYKLDISWESIDYMGQDGLVMAAIIPTRRKIIMNDSCKELFEEKIGTLNFTMAHELGHWVLHVEDKLNQQISFLFNDLNDAFYCRNLSKKPPEEYQADMFAGSLLMPRPIIEPLIDDLKRSRKIISFPDLYRVCDVFGVSISALKVRLHYLNLLYIDVNGKIHKSKEEYSGQITFNI